MHYALQILKIALVILGSVVAIPLLIILALLAMVTFVVALVVVRIRRLVTPGPRWDDGVYSREYEAEAVRADSGKQNKRPIIIDHE